MNRRKWREGLRKAAAKGRLPGRPLTVPDAAILEAIPLGTAAGARKVGLSKTQFIERRRRLEEQDGQ